MPPQHQQLLDCCNSTSTGNISPMMMSDPSTSDHAIAPAATSTSPSTTACSSRKTQQLLKKAAESTISTHSSSSSGSSSSAASISTTTSSNCSAASSSRALLQIQGKKSILKVSTQEESLLQDLDQKQKQQSQQRRYRTTSKSSSSSSFSAAFSSHSKQQHQRRRCRFEAVEILQYPICLGNNPAVHGGLPLALDYSQPPHTVQSWSTVEEHERSRWIEQGKQNSLLLLKGHGHSHSRDRNRNNHRRNTTTSTTNTNTATTKKTTFEQLRLCEQVRHYKVQQEAAVQYTPQELAQALQDIRKVQRRRAMTEMTPRSVQWMQERAERMRRVVYNATWNRRQKQTERLRLGYTQSKSYQEKRNKRPSPNTPIHV